MALILAFEGIYSLSDTVAISLSEDTQVTLSVEPLGSKVIHTPSISPAVSRNDFLLILIPVTTCLPSLSQADIIAKDAIINK